MKTETLIVLFRILAFLLVILFVLSIPIFVRLGKEYLDWVFFGDFFNINNYQDRYVP